MNITYLLRLTWDSRTCHWLILLQPVDATKPRVFVDVESAFAYVARSYVARSYVVSPNDAFPNVVQLSA